MSNTNKKKTSKVTEQNGGMPAMDIAEDIRVTWKTMDRMTLMTQCLVCLLPIVAGVLAYDRLPDMMAIHWGFGNEPNGWAPREFVVFGVPVMMALMQLVLVLSTEGMIRSSQSPKGDESSDDVAENEQDNQSDERRGEIAQPTRYPVKAFAVIYWLIPAITVVLYAMTIASALGESVPIGKVTLGVLSLVLIVSGNYAQKMPYSIARKTTHPVPKSEQAYRRYAKVCSYGMMALGLACLIGAFFV